LNRFNPGMNFTCRLYKIDFNIIIPYKSGFRFPKSLHNCGFRYIFNVFVLILVSLPSTKLFYCRLNKHHIMLLANCPILFITLISPAIFYILLFPCIISIQLSDTKSLRRTFIFCECNAL